MKSTHLLIGSILLAVICSGCANQSVETAKLRRQLGQARVETALMHIHWKKVNSEPIPFDTAMFDHEESSIIEVSVLGQKKSETTPNEYEKSLIERWTNAPLNLTKPETNEFAARHLAEKQEYVYYEAVRIKSKDCLDCHRAIAFGPDSSLNLGDLLAIVKIRMSTM
jgi:hypothetical protein